MKRTTLICTIVPIIAFYSTSFAARPSDPPGDLSVPVTVTNDETQPVPVTIQGDATNEPVVTQPSKTQINADVQFIMNGGLVNSGDQTIFTVPTTQRYVIESVSVWTFTANCDFVLMPSIRTTAGGETSEFGLHAPDSTFNTSSNFYKHHGTWPVKLYADPDTTVSVNMLRSGNDTSCSATLRVSLAGYLEDDK